MSRRPPTVHPLGNSPEVDLQYRQRTEPAAIGQNSSDTQNRKQHMAIGKSKKPRFRQTVGEGFDILQQAASSGILSLFRLLLHWDRSVYKLIWLDMLIFLVLYFILSIVYRLALSDKQMKEFENVVLATDYWVAKVPITFLLGFYVSSILGRWISTYNGIPRLGSFAFTLRRSIQDNGSPEKARQMRVLLSRYVNLAWVLGLRPRCADLQDRLSADVANEATADVMILRQHLLRLNDDPVIQQYYGRLVSATEVETLIEAAKERSTGTGRLGSPDWWIPLQWAGAIVDSASAQGFIADSSIASGLNGEIQAVRGQITGMINVCERPLPLVYHQVVIIAVYVLYLTNILARQFLIPSRVNKSAYGVDYYFPIFTICEMIFIIGWFKVAFVLLNPFGDDEEDFKFSAILNANLRCCSIAAQTPIHLYPSKLVKALAEPKNFEPADIQQALDYARDETNYTVQVHTV